MGVLLRLSVSLCSADAIREQPCFFSLGKRYTLLDHRRRLLSYIHVLCNGTQHTGLGVFLPALDFFLPAFGVTREKDARLRRCFFASTIVGGKKPARPRRCFFASAYGAKKGRGPEKVWFCQGMGVFFCQRICRRAQVRGEMRLRKGVPVPCEGEKRREKIILRRGFCEKNCTIQHCSTAR